MLAPADPSEAAAIVAAVEQFLADTAPAPVAAPARSDNGSFRRKGRDPDDTGSRLAPDRPRTLNVD